jgi:hypothetical protein
MDKQRFLHYLYEVSNQHESHRPNHAFLEPEMLNFFTEREAYNHNLSDFLNIMSRSSLPFI